MLDTRRHRATEGVRHAHTDLVVGRVRRLVAEQEEIEWRLLVGLEPLDRTGDGPCGRERPEVVAVRFEQEGMVRPDRDGGTKLLGGPGRSER